MNGVRQIRVFISSPSDVAEERDRARQVVEQLRRRYVGRFDLKAVLWEALPLQADMSFQEGIDLVLSREQGVDIAIFILWSRLGSPVGALIRKPDGSAYRSGTEREFDLVLAARRENRRRDPNSDAPKILIYTRNDKASFDERLRGKPTAEQKELLKQKELVESFIQEEFHDIASGTNVRAYHPFDQPVKFSHRLREHLQEILDFLAGGADAKPEWDLLSQGSPFRGLEPFEFEHSPVFFGREDEVLEVRRALQKKAQEGCAFVLISGASGSGKSSLARAGIVPAVVEYEVDSTVIAWRCAVCTPSQFEGNLCGGLARLLCSESVLPELQIAKDSVTVLGDGLAAAPTLTVDQSIRPALLRASRGKSGSTRLLLLVDQFEELFTDKRFDDAERERFAAALEALARSGVVWVLTTVRTDFYQHCQRLPTLMRMKDGPGQVDLLPPTADAMRRLIERPALLAGLRFEEKDGASLADRILEDATKHAELLPLVSYVLRELFEQRAPPGVLTFAAYEHLGGVEGALAKRAEAVFSALPIAAQRELPQVLRALVSVRGDEEDSVVRQRVPLATFAPEIPSRIMVDRFVSERFLTTDRSGDGTAMVTVAHEAVLRAWSRAAQWIQDNRDFLRTRARITARMNEGSRLLEGDPLLELARHHLTTARGGFTREQIAFIEKCAEAAQQARRKRERLITGVAVAFGIISCVAIGAGWFAWNKKTEAETARRSFEAATAVADNNLYALHMRTIEQLWREDKLSLIRELLQQHQPIDGKRDLRGFEWYFWNRQVNSEMRLLTTASGEITALGFSSDARWLALALGDNTITLRDLDGSNGVSTLKGPDCPAHSIAFDSDLLAAACGSNIYVWSIGNGKQIANFQAQCERLLFSPFGERLACAAGNNVVLRDARTGQELLVLEEAKKPSVPFIPGLTGSGTTYAVNAVGYVTSDRGGLFVFGTGAPIAHQAGISFSPDGRKVASVHSDGSIRIWATDSATEQMSLRESGRESLGITSVAFSPDSRWLVSAGVRGSIRLWDAESGLEQAAQRDETTVFSAAFINNSWQVASINPNRIVVWDYDHKERALIPLSNVRLPGQRELKKVAFSPNGRRLALVCGMNEVWLWEASHAGGLTTLWRSVPAKDGPADPVPNVALSPNGSRMAILTSDGTCRVSDMEAGAPLSAFSVFTGVVATASQNLVPLVWSSPTVVLRFSADGERIAILRNHSTCTICDARTGHQITAFETSPDPGKHVSGDTSVIFSPDSGRIATVGSSGHIQLWDFKTRGEILSCNVTIRYSGPFQMAFNTDGRFFGALDAERKSLEEMPRPNSFRLWDALTGHELNTFCAYSNLVWSFVFGPDPHRVVIEFADGTLTAFDLTSGRQLLIFETVGTRKGHVSWHRSPLVFSSDGRWLASADGVVWDANTGRKQATFDAGRSVVFSPDGRRLGVAMWDGGGMIVDTISGHKLMSTLAPPLGFSADGKQMVCFDRSGLYLYWGSPIGRSPHDRSAMTQRRVPIAWEEEWPSDATQRIRSVR